MSVAEQRASDPSIPVIVVGAGPVGLAVTTDLLLRGFCEVMLVDEGEGAAPGSPAICWSRRTLEIINRLGVGRTLIERGVTWQIGRVYDGDEMSGLADPQIWTAERDTQMSRALETGV